MKNYLLLRWCVLLSNAINQLFLVMRFTAILLLLGTMHLSGKTLSQTITFHARNTGLKQVFATVEQQTGYAVLYSDEMIAGIKPVSVNVKGMPLEAFLIKVLSPASLTYRIDGTSIFIKPSNQAANLPKLNLVVPEQQQRTIAGRVTDDTQQPLEGVTVTVKGTSVVTTTDSEGNYQIQLPEEGTVLAFSNIGFAPVEVSIAGRQHIDIAMVPTVSDLEEVVVVGYGTMRRKDLTGAVSSVNAGQIRDIGVIRVDQALSGRVAGVQVKTVSGEPGIGPQIRVRGVGSISAGVNPLFVVDGFPTDNIQTLNPNDIESVDVLKDASATAIYGSRGANGVVIINTKRGRSGVNTFSFDTYYGFQRVSKLPKMKNAMEQAQYTYDGFRNRNIDEGRDVSGHASTWAFPAPSAVIDVLEGRNTYDQDPFASILRTAPQSQYQLTAMGGGDNVRYSLSGEALNQDGIVLNSNFRRYSLRTNVDVDLSKRLSLKLNLNPSFTQRAALPSYTGGFGGGPIGSAMSIHNFFPLVDEDGEYVFLGGNAALFNITNPLATLNETITSQSAARMLANVNANYKLTDHLSLDVL